MFRLRTILKFNKLWSFYSFIMLQVFGMEIKMLSKEGTHIVETVTIVVSDLLPEIEFLLL